MSKPRISWLWLSIGVSLVSAIVFAVSGCLSIGYSVHNVAWLAGAGAIFGAIGAPYVEPKVFRYPILWQTSFSVLGCVLVGAALGAGPGGYGLAVIVGLILGFLAPYWIGHLPLP